MKSTGIETSNSLAPFQMLKRAGSALCCTTVVAVSTQAATILGTDLGFLAGNQPNGDSLDGIEISLFDPANSYIHANPNVPLSYSAGDVTLNGVIDYHFYNSGLGTPDLSLAGAAHIANAVAAGTTIRTNRRNDISFYTTKSPAGAYDAVLTGGVDLAGNSTLTGTVDLTGLDPNTPVAIYVLGFSWNNTINLSITPFDEGVAGTKEDDLVSHANVGSNRGRSFVSRVDISDFSDIDRIDFELEGNEAGLHGIIVTQVPEPGSLALMGLGGLLMLRRSSAHAARRRRG